MYALYQGRTWQKNRIQRGELDENNFDKESVVKIMLFKNKGNHIILDSVCNASDSLLSFLWFAAGKQ